MKKSLGLLLLSTVALLPACSSNNSQSADSTTQSMQVFNDADVMFAQMMIPHHEQAIEMSDIALDPTTGGGQQVRDLALQIKNAQDPEIQQMKEWLTAWGKPDSPEDGMDHSSMMSGMLTAEELTELGTLRGQAFDQKWITGMIAHHKGAIEMANAVLKDGTNTQVLELATSIISTQQAEINTLTSMLG
jgi:uncharacterized protein (DUF305 family)